MQLGRAGGGGDSYKTLSSCVCLFFPFRASVISTKYCCCVCCTGHACLHVYMKQPLPSRGRLSGACIVASLPSISSMTPSCACLFVAIGFRLHEVKLRKIQKQKFEVQQYTTLHDIQYPYPISYSTSSIFPHIYTTSGYRELAKQDPECAVQL